MFMLISWCRCSYLLKRLKRKIKSWEEKKKVAREKRINGFINSKEEFSHSSMREEEGLLWLLVGHDVVKATRVVSTCPSLTHTVHNLLTVHLFSC